MTSKAVNMEVPKRIYSVKEAAEYLGRSAWTVAEMVRTGKIKYVKDGKRIFLDVLDIDRWIEGNKTQNLD